MNLNKKTLLFISFFILIVSNASLAKYYPSKIFELSDGTILKGKLIGLRKDDGAYLIETTDLGTVAVQAENVVRMDNPPTAIQIPTTQMPVPQNLSAQLQNGSTKQAVQQMQSIIVSDPNIMASLQELMADPEIMAIFQDPSLMQDLMSMDPSTIQSNPNIQKLMQNPVMQQIIQKAGQKMTAQGNGLNN